ncbi:hypothetical protein HNY73_014083 [Argiope bruennichi]|uniref:Uncharacterized protein n=1 Tax=Argiope bruennichi TaxID=94029 RepID=A0A8T0ET26_ARGBR|nr:hypothetical protein HNY73_014083 [Argiope bruennichi]
MWEMFFEPSEPESWIRLLLKIANQIVFLMLLVRFLHRKLHGTTSWNSLWKSLTVVCCTLLANYCIWPLFLDATHFLVSRHNHWTLAILLMTIEWTSNRWFTTDRDPTTVPSSQPAQWYLSDQKATTICHSQGDVSERINSIGVQEIEKINTVNFDPTKTIPVGTENHLQGNILKQNNSKSIHEGEYIDVENFDPTETRSKGTQTKIPSPSPSLKVENNSNPGSGILFNLPQYKVMENSQPLASNANVMKLITRSGRIYFRN